MPRFRVIQRCVDVHTFEVEAPDEKTAMELIEVGDDPSIEGIDLRCDDSEIVSVYEVKKKEG